MKRQTQKEGETEGGRGREGEREEESERGWRSVFRTPVRETHSGVPVYAQGTRVPGRGGPERPSSRREERGEQRKDAKKTKDRSSWEERPRAPRARPAPSTHTEDSQQSKTKTMPNVPLGIRAFTFYHLHACTHTTQPTHQHTNTPTRKHPTTNKPTDNRPDTQHRALVEHSSRSDASQPRSSRREEEKSQVPKAQRHNDIVSCLIVTMRWSLFMDVRGVWIFG